MSCPQRLGAQRCPQSRLPTRTCQALPPHGSCMDSARQASTAQRRVMVLTREPRLAEHILAVCAAADVEAEMLTDPAGLRGLWSAAALVIVGMDQAEQVV